MHSKSKITNKNSLQSLLENRKKSRSQLFDSHHLEFVMELNGVSYVNDAASITMQQSRMALEKIDAEIIWLLHPYVKNNYNSLVHFTERNLKGIISIGGHMNCYAKDLAKSSRLYVNASSIKEGIKVAKNLAKPNQVVLFSPSSNPIFDRKSIKERGDEFKKLVANLKQEKK